MAGRCRSTPCPARCAAAGVEVQLGAADAGHQRIDRRPADVAGKRRDVDWSGRRPVAPPSPEAVEHGDAGVAPRSRTRCAGSMIAAWLGKVFSGALKLSLITLPRWWSMT